MLEFFPTGFHRRSCRVDRLVAIALLCFWFARQGLRDVFQPIPQSLREPFGSSLRHLPYPGDMMFSFIIISGFYFGHLHCWRAVPFLWDSASVLSVVVVVIPAHPRVVELVLSSVDL